MENPNDLAQSFMAAQAAREQAASLDWLRERATALRGPADAGAPPAAPPGGMTPARPGLQDAMDNARQMRLGRGLVDARQPAPQPFAPVRATIEGISQLAVGGPIEAVREAFRAADDVANWLDSSLPADGPGNLIARNIPNLPAPETQVGQAARKLGQLLFGFWRGMAVSRGAAGAGGVAQAARVMGATAIAEGLFTNADAPRLFGDVWRQAGLPDNVLSEFLASDPADTAMESRVKAAIDGAALGGIGEGLFRSVRALRASVAARRSGEEAGAPATEDIVARMRQQYGEVVPERDWMLLGNAAADAPLVMRRGSDDAADKIAAAMRRIDEGATPPAGDLAATADTTARQGFRAQPGDLYFNWARVNGPDDIKALQREIIERFRPEIEAARRGVQPQAETERLAAQMGMTVDDLLARRAGQAFNPEETTAARMLLEDVSARAMEAVRRAAAPNAGPQDEFVMRRMLATHAAVQAEVMGIRAETARALAAWRIPAGSAVERARAVAQMMEQSGGSATAQALARRLASLEREGLSAADLAMAMRQSWSETSTAVFGQIYTNALVSDPATHGINILSNILTGIAQPIERAAAAHIGRAMGAADRAAVEEARFMYYGMITGMKDAFRLAARTWRDGTGEVGMLLSRADLPVPNAISARGLGVGEGTALGRALDFIGHSIVSVPTRALGAEDAFFKSVAYRMELHAQAARIAAGEGLAGPAAGQRIAGLVRDPTEAMRLAASEQALYQTFNREAGVGTRVLMSARNTGIPLIDIPATWFMPFIRTPINILHFSAERTPLALLQTRWWGDIAAGGARAQLALARLSTGTVTLAVLADLADSGLITGRGPDDPGERANWERTGWKPDSARIGDRWIQINRLDPGGFAAVFAAEMMDLIRRYEVEPEEIDEPLEILKAGIAAISYSVVNKTWMQGMSMFADAFSRPEMGAERLLNRAAGTPIPALVANAAARLDGFDREMMDAAEALMARIPGLRERLTLRRDLWGQPVRPEYNWLQAATGLRASDVRDSPIDREMARLNVNIEPVARRVSFARGDGIRVDMNLRDWPQVLDAYRRLAGNELKLDAFGGLGARDALNEMVQGRGPMAETYRMRAEGRDENSKGEMIRSIVQRYREAARQQIMTDPQFADFQAAASARREQRVERARPVLQ